MGPKLNLFWILTSVLAVEGPMAVFSCFCNSAGSSVAGPGV